MIHLGDITQLRGDKVPIVDIVCGGSPCQDLSVAGKRAGLDGERSGLFLEQIRLVKEMRDESRQLCMRGADDHIRPRYMVWENVPGAFSSNKGEDFRCVLEETARIADKDTVIPRLEGGAKWSPSGCILGDGWSIAWRVHDAQFWGVPQRRKRISLVADFGGSSAPEILFERESLSGDIEKSAEQGKGTSESVEGCADTAIYDVRISSDGTKNWRAHCYTTDICRNLDTGGRNQIATTEDQQSSKCLNSWDVQSKHIQPEDGIAEALYSGECRGGGGESYVMQGKVYCLQGNGIDRADTAGCNGKGWREDQSYTLNTIDRPAVCVSQDAYDKYALNEKSASLKASGGTIGGGSESLVIQ